MGNPAPSGILVFGHKLYSAEWEQVRDQKPELYNRITVCVDSSMPETAFTEGVAYIDLENTEFSSPSFFRRLADSFDKLRIVGIAQTVADDRVLELAKLGVSEILTLEEYHARMTTLLREPVTENNPTPIIDHEYGLSAIIGKSAQIVAIKKMIDHLTDVDYPNAIIFGETGTGKDLIAKVMHYTGVRKDNNFIEVNCSAIPDDLFESELFGHKKGAFTDAKSDKTGLFEYADNGALFLDEIGNLSPTAQAKLLKILESRKLRQLGGVKEKSINVRVIAATNVNLEEAVMSGKFREDLLFRLNLITFQLPPLRERKEDIAELALHSFDFYRTLYKKPWLSLDNDAIAGMLEHSWPGNVRELRNVIERAVLLANSHRITREHIHTAIKNGRVTARERRRITIEIPDQGINLRAIEKQVVGEILNMVGWNRSEAARLLGVSRARLRRIMEENKLLENKRTGDLLDSE